MKVEIKIRIGLFPLTVLLGPLGEDIVEMIGKRMRERDFLELEGEVVKIREGRYMSGEGDLEVIIGQQQS